MLGDVITAVRVAGAKECGGGGRQDPGNALLGILGSEHAGTLKRRKPATGKRGALGLWQDEMQISMQGAWGRGERRVRVRGLLESRDVGCRGRWKYNVQHTGTRECWQAGFWKRVAGTLGSDPAGMMERRKPATGMRGALGHWQDGMQISSVPRYRRHECQAFL
eukprot:gene13095-biopygen5255